MLIAEALGAGFAYHWSEAEIPARDQQATEALDAVFNVNFRRAHRSGKPNMHYPVLRGPLQDASAVAAARTLGASKGQLLVDRPHDLRDCFAGLGPFSHDCYRTAFNAIGFARPVRDAIALARSVPISRGAAAIHIRGGDIIHGTHSFHGAYLHKAPSIVDIDTAVRKLSRDGREVWLIGQEPDVQEAMVARHPELRAFGITDHIDGSLTSVGAVMFDAIVLSRMAHICGGKSGVSRLAMRIGEASFSDIGSQEAESGQERAREDDLLAEMSRISAASRAHMYSKKVVAVPPANWTEEHLAQVRTARRLRSANAFLQLLEVCVLARVAGPQEGEQAASAFLTAPKLETDVVPEIGYAFLMGGSEFFPITMTAELLPNAGPATELLHSVGQVLADNRLRASALRALARADEALVPDGIDPALRERFLFCINGGVGSWDTISWKSPRS